LSNSIGISASLMNVHLALSARTERECQTDLA
jgi:hypothetical protein